MGMRTSKNNSHSVISEINVTPFVDVMLVLLIIFMVTAPILYQGVDVNLPKVESKPMPAAEREKKLILTIDAKGNVYIDKEPIPFSGLKLKVREEIAARGGDFENEYVFLRADSAVPYGNVIDVMAEVQKAGVVKVGLVTEPIGKSDNDKSSSK